MNLVYSASEVSVGDAICYPGRRSARRGPINSRDWLLVSGIVAGDILGKRLFPEEWESEIEFTVFENQVAGNGVLIDNRILASSTAPEAQPSHTSPSPRSLEVQKEGALE